MTNLKNAYDAVKKNDVVETVALLDEDPTLVNAHTPFGPLLHVAAGSGNVQIIEILLKHGADINACGGTYGGNALNYAATCGQVPAASFLLDHGALIDTSDPERNPLFGAILAGNIEMVRLLLSKEIDVDVRYSGESMKEMDAKAFAIERGQSEIAALL